MYVHTPRLFLNLSTVAHAERRGNVVKLILMHPALCQHVEVNHPEDAEAVWKGLAGWAQTFFTMPWREASPAPDSRPFREVLASHREAVLDRSRDGAEAAAWATPPVLIHPSHFAPLAGGTNGATVDLPKPPEPPAAAGPAPTAPKPRKGK